MATKQGPKDINETAYRIVSEATGEAPKTEPKAKSESATNRGKARAAGLSASRRSEIARVAANVRWSQ